MDQRSKGQHQCHLKVLEEHAYEKYDLCNFAWIKTYTQVKSLQEETNSPNTLCPWLFDLWP